MSAAMIDTATATSGQRSRTASTRGPARTRAIASASTPLRSGWLLLAPKVPMTWNTAMPSALNSTTRRGILIDQIVRVTPPGDIRRAAHHPLRPTAYLTLLRRERCDLVDDEVRLDVGSHARIAGSVTADGGEVRCVLGGHGV